MAIKPLEILINAKDNASGILSGVGEKLKGVGAAVLAYFTVDTFLGAVTSAANFEAALSRIRAATNASAEEMAAFKAAAQDAGAASKYTATEAAGALEGLAKAGLNSKEAIAALPAAMALAQAGDISLEQASEHLTSAIFGMGLQFSETGRVADVLSKSANESKTNVNGMADAFSKAAPISRQLGVGIEGLAALVGQFVSAGVGANEVGTALTSVMTQFSDPASKFKQELAALGITTTDFEKALHQLAATGSKGEAAIRSVGDAGPILLAGLSRGMPALDALKKSLMSAEGSAAAAAKMMDEGLNGAMGKLASAWETVRVALGTPVLPVLKRGVDELVAALNTAVSNGTIGKFGDALASAFKSASAWLRAFVAETDFKALATNLQGMATSIGAAFGKIGEYASTVGNSFKLFYGLMSAGSNTVMAGIYAIGEAFAGVASNIQSGLALLYEGIAKIPFGKFSKDYAQAAAEMKLSAQATWAASEALGKKATEAFIAVGEGAQKARDGFAGLSEESKKLDVSSKAVTDTTNKLSESAIKEGEAWLQASKELTVAKEATDKKRASDNAAIDAIQKLREEYRALAKSGDLQGAVLKLQEVEKALAGIGKEAQKSAEEVKKSNKEIENAYIILGVTSNTALKNIADAAKTNYEIIKNSGVASARELSESFKSYAEKAIAANNGVASAAIQAEAALRGYKVEVDDTGKASLKLVTVTNDVAASFVKAGEAIKAKAAAAKAESDLLISGLNLRKSELDAEIKIAEAKGDTGKVIKLQIEQKKIEIQIIRETVKAQIAEAEASMAVAKAKMSELAASGQLTPEKRAELEAAIKSGEAKINEAKARGESVKVLEQEISDLQKSSSAQRDNASSINQTTAALEKLNAEKEKEIAALEKANELKQREIDLYLKKWKMDADHNSVDANGKKIEATIETQQSLYNKAIDAGLSPLQAKQIADRMAPNNGGFADMNAFWKEINSIKQQNDLNAEIIQKIGQKIQDGTATGMDLEAFKGAGGTPPPPKPTSTQPPMEVQKNQGTVQIKEAPKQQSPTSVVNLHYNGQSVGTVQTTDAGAGSIQKFMQLLEAAKATAS